MPNTTLDVFSWCGHSWSRLEKLGAAPRQKNTYNLVWQKLNC